MDIFNLNIDNYYISDTCNLWKYKILLTLIKVYHKFLYGFQYILSNIYVNMFVFKTPERLSVEIQNSKKFKSSIIIFNTCNKLLLTFSKYTKGILFKQYWSFYWPILKKLEFNLNDFIRRHIIWSDSLIKRIK